jgi:outer membrane receptor protein involved in Fe transport
MRPPSPPRREVGGFVVLACTLALSCPCSIGAQQCGLSGHVRDMATDASVPGALVSLSPPPSSSPTETLSTYSDSTGQYRFVDIEPGEWQLFTEALGYRAQDYSLKLSSGSNERDIFLALQPLLMDELIVRTQREDGRDAFIESIDIRGRGGDLVQKLDAATGVNIRRNGGLGSFSTVSIRGSTSEQVQVFLDGVPLNSASGGGVDFGRLPLAGVERVEIYRGAVPVQFGGNSIGGVVHIRTQDPGATPRAYLHMGSGSFASRQLGASLAGPWNKWQYLGLLDYSTSANTFDFWDDNGTEYNASDDGRANRLNSDFTALRALFKLGRPTGNSHLQLHSTFDLSHKGIPGIGNNQSLHTRFDTWRYIIEANLYGPRGSGAYRLKAYHSIERDIYKDLLGEVGIGVQHQRNTTRGGGMRGELNFLLPEQGLATLFANANQQQFQPRDELRQQSRLRASRRRALTLGGEVEIPLFTDRFTLRTGGQWQGLGDRLFDVERFAANLERPIPTNREKLWGMRLSLSADLGAGWKLQGHRGRHQRAPSFFELFGDRGAVRGNSSLTSETGYKSDLGLVFRSTAQRKAGLMLAELTYYHNRVENLIRFIHNSQQVSQPHNLGEALLRGVETRWQVHLLPFVQLSGNYVYQRAENRSPFTFEKGNDLPNAPRHRVNTRLEFEGFSSSLLHYEYSGESRHFLDRANLRPVPRRKLHSIGARVNLKDGIAFSAEIRNLSNNRVADIWGYPLPGRSYFATLNYTSIAQN